MAPPHPLPARTRLAPGRGRDQNSQSQAGWASGERGAGCFHGAPHGKAPLSLSPHHFQCRSCRHTQLHPKPLRVITNPRFLLGFHLFNHPFSSASNTLSSVRGQKHSLYIQKDKSSLQQLLYLTEKIHWVAMAALASKNRPAISSTAESTGSADGSCFP